MSFSSFDSYRKFNRAVRREFRYARTPEQEEFLKTVAATSHSRSVTMKAGLVLWRAQLGYSWREEQQDGHSYEVQAAHPPARMKPIAEKASDGRANPKGIACLYLATKQETAVLEIRPLIGSYVSVAQFKLNKELKIVNCSADRVGNLLEVFKESWTSEETEKQVWSDMNKAFSKPVERADDSVDYVPTQVITEIFKINKFDGIAYKSSYGEDGLNVALFDINFADLVNCTLHRIEDISVILSQQDNPYFVEEDDVGLKNAAINHK